MTTLQPFLSFLQDNFWFYIILW